MPLDAWVLSTLAEARSHLQLADTKDDSMVERLLTRASARINGYCGRRLKSATYQKVTGPPASDTRLVLDGNGSQVIRLPQYPVTAFSSAVYLDENNNEFPLEITGARVDRAAGIVTLTRDMWRLGEQNILVACTAGYTSADAEDLSVLEYACLRLVEAYYQRWKNRLGITERASEGGVATSFLTDEMPKDVADMLSPYMWRGSV